MNTYNPIINVFFRFKYLILALLLTMPCHLHAWEWLDGDDGYGDDDGEIEFPIIDIDDDDDDGDGEGDGDEYGNGDGYGEEGGDSGYGDGEGDGYGDGYGNGDGYGDGGDDGGWFNDGWWNWLTDPDPDDPYYNPYSDNSYYSSSEYGEVLQYAADDIWSTIADLSSAAYDSISDIFSDIGNTLWDIFEDACLDFTTDLLNPLGHAYADVGYAMAWALDGIAEGLGTLDNMGVDEFFGGLNTMFSSNGSTGWEALDKILGTAQFISGAAELAISKGPGFLHDLADDLDQAMDDIVNWLDTTF
ncbi:hypothetical protein OH491_15260 [Termitidicoccus mucosus]|uniref:hypothetical protein n=1 Tax=Termitidicoccus mucosus TaxID=1184151 RepID=UPI0031846A75